VLTFEDALEMMQTAQSLQSPVAASNVPGKETHSRVPFAVYVVRKAD
jgi:hypothetical protein